MQLTDSAVLPVKSAPQLRQEELDAQKAAAEAATAASTPELFGLISLVRSKWTAAKEAKIDAELKMSAMVRQRAGEYDPVKLAKIKAAKQPDIFMNVTDTKCRNAVAQVKDIVIHQNNRIFSVSPTPIPELPDEITQQIYEGTVKQFLNLAAQQAATMGQELTTENLRGLILQHAEEIKRRVHIAILQKSKEMAKDIEDRVDDQWVQGGFYKALEQAVDDIINLKCGIIKGPIFRRERLRKNVMDPTTGRITKKIEEKIIPEYERRSPFAIFPSPKSTGIDSGYLFDVTTIRPRELFDLQFIPGYSRREIIAVLKEFHNGALKEDWLQLSTETKEGINIENPNRQDSSPENIYCLELWDEIPGDLLLEWGMSEEDIPDPNNEYPVCIWMIGTHVIRAMLNYDETGKKPFSKTSFQTENDSFWGSGIPEKIEDCQTVCNACARAILANVGQGSVPQTGINVDRLAPGQSRQSVPGRVWEMTNEEMGSSVPPIQWYQPPMVTQQLMAVYTTFSRIADEHSGVPAFSHGDSQVGGAGNTSSGLAQLRAMAAQGIRAVVRNIDLDLITTCLERHYNYLLDNFDIYGLLGDYHLVAKGTAAMEAKDQEIQRQMEYTNYTGNPIDIQLVGAKNRRKILLTVAKNLGIELDETEFGSENIPVQQPDGSVPGQQPPQPGTATLDQAGNPVVGQDTRQFNPERPRLSASTPGNPGGAF